jgi:hypothetical protein
MLILALSVIFSLFRSLLTVDGVGSRNIIRYNRMATKPMAQGLHQPTIMSLTKEEYSMFRWIRNLSTLGMGSHLLLCRRHKKYISKELPPSLKFLTSRPKHQMIYTHNFQGKSEYIFELLGEPLADVRRQTQGPEIKRWVEHCGGLDNALADLIRYCIRLHTTAGISDLLLECFRVAEGRLHYCYDTWMKSTLEIVSENRMHSGEFENYFLSEDELTQISANKLAANIEVTSKSYLYKLGLFILSLALPETQIRNYDY